MSKLKIPGIVVAFLVMLVACTNAVEPAYDERWLDITKVGQIDCKTVDMPKLEATLTYVEKAVGSTERSILKRSPEGTTKESLRQELSNKVAECKLGSAEKTTVVANDGTQSQLPVVPDNTNIIVGDSTRDPDTPPVMNNASLPEQCHSAINWTQVRDCVGTEQWYIDGINMMKPFSGFNWDDVLKWADAKRPDGTPVGDARLIQVYHLTEEQKPKDAAKNDVRDLVGNDQALEQMQVAPYKGDFINTRELENERVSPFVDQARQVRVSIAPLVLNEKGEAVGLDPNGGVFVDCWNIWGMAYAIAPAPGKPAVCPGTNMPIPPEGPKGCSPPGTTTTVPTTTTQVCCTITTTPPQAKNPNEGSNNQGNAPQGGGQKEQQGPGTWEPPPVVVTTTYQAPPPPPVNTTPPGTPTNTGTPPPTNPGAGPSNTGTVPPPP